MDSNEPSFNFLYMKPISSFNSYRAYLQAFYEWKKQGSAGYSYARFSARAAVNSPNFLKLVISGSRNLTISTIHKFASAMNLSPEETEYFEALVLRDQSDEPAQKRYYARRLLKMKSVKGRRLSTRSDRSQPIENWFDLAALVGMQGRGYGEGRSFVAGQTGMPPETIAEVISRMRQSGLLSEGENGKYHAAFNHVLFRDLSSSRVKHRKFLGEQLALSAMALDKAYGKETSFFSETFTIGSDSFRVFSDLVQDAIRNLSLKGDLEPPEEIVQLNVQFFPIRTIGKLVGKAGAP